MNKAIAAPETLTPDLLIVGGDQDPNLIRLMAKCGEKGIKFHTCFKGQSGTPAIAYDIASDNFYVDGKILKPKSVFIRADVFQYLQDNNLASWHAANDWANVFQGWIIAHPEIRTFNHAHFNKPLINKTAVLVMARDIGFQIPRTVMTNSVAFINDFIGDGVCIQKPVDGGEHTQKLEKLPVESYPNGKIARPIIIQQLLDYPELRIFCVGGKMMGFKITSERLDYREVNDAHIIETDVPKDLAEKMQRLSSALGLDYCAADFKTCPDTGDFLFLEINSMAMFAGFDARANGKLITMILDHLLIS